MKVGKENFICRGLVCIFLLPNVLLGPGSEVFYVRGWNKFVHTTKNHLSRLNLLCRLHFILSRLDSYLGVMCSRFFSASECRYKTRCVICSGPHNASECKPRDIANEELSTLRCTHCRGERIANYGGCPYMKSARVVEKVRAEKNMSNKDAVLAVKAQNFITYISVSSNKSEYQVSSEH